VGATGCVATNTVRAVLWPNGPDGPVIDLGKFGGTAFNIAFAIKQQRSGRGSVHPPGNTLIHAFFGKTV
jgi:hypothetical protein